MLAPLLPGPAPFCLVLTLSVRAACERPVESSQTRFRNDLDQLALAGA